MIKPITHLAITKRWWYEKLVDVCFSPPATQRYAESYSYMVFWKNYSILWYNHSSTRLILFEITYKSVFVSKQPGRNFIRNGSLRKMCRKKVNISFPRDTFTVHRPVRILCQNTPIKINIYITVLGFFKNILHILSIERSWFCHAM